MVETRTGSYTFTQNFGIGQYYGAPVQSVIFPTEEVAVIPVLVEFNNHSPDPSGFRHINVGSGVHESFLAIRASGHGNASHRTRDQR